MTVAHCACFDPSLEQAGLKRRNALVFAEAASRRVPLVLTMGGGYPRDLDESSTPFLQVVQAHMDCYRQCASVHAKRLRS